jgi:WXG100 family type VII secretion target
VSGYAVDPAQLLQGDTHLAAGAEAARGALAQLRAAAADVFAGWHGAAAAAFRLGWEQWLDGVLLMLDALDAMATALGTAGLGYSATDDAVRTRVAAALR